MARLDGIIRLRKWELDEQRRILAGLEEEGAQIQATITALYDERADEEQKARGEVAMLTYGHYLEGFKVRVDHLTNMLQAKEEEINKQRDIVAEAFRELKTYEIADERAKERAKKKEEKFEQAMLDEQGLQKHFRDRTGQ